MTKKGWDFVQAYTTSDPILGYDYHYLLKKKTSLLKPEEINGMN